MPFNESMEDFESEVSVIDVYDIASEIGKEFEKIIDCYGSEAVTGLMPKVITALEHLEVLATKNERENSNVQDLEAKILKLESDKLEKAEDRLRYERELELIEDHWKKETQDLESVVNTLQDENRKLKNALAAKQDLPAQQMAPEVDIAALQRLRGMVDQLRDKLRKADREISSKSSEIDDLSNQVKRMTNMKKDMSRKQRLMQFQVRGLVDERADFLAQIQDLSHANVGLREQLGEAVQENALLFNACKDNCTEVVQEEDPNRPRFTTAELKEILHERNNLKARVSDLEDELESFRPKQAPESLTESEIKEDPDPCTSLPNTLLVVGWPLTTPINSTHDPTALGRGFNSARTSSVRT
uniref:RH1 domain-containing protein n=1 Tax=Graphocephala atropunctata TaxID=36148 RepID=A0A1B6KHP7_9HEMI